MAESDVPAEVTVSDGSTTETCDVTDVHDHRGNTFAQVEGDEIKGVVEL